MPATDALLHGEQEGRFFHAYYGGYCYLPVVRVLQPAPAGEGTAGCRLHTFLA